MPVRLLPPVPLDRVPPQARRNRFGHEQILTGFVLHELLHPSPDALAAIALTAADLYPDPSWNFVFGQASLAERVGVYSFARYAATAGKPAPDPAKLVLLRSAKVLAHETGHMFGLLHCVYYKCLMNGSNHLGELDARPLHLCPICLRMLQWSTRFDVLARYRELAGVTRQAGFDEEARWLDARVKTLETR